MPEIQSLPKQWIPICLTRCNHYLWLNVIIIYTSFHNHQQHALPYILLKRTILMNLKSLFGYCSAPINTWLSFLYFIGNVLQEIENTNKILKPLNRFKNAILLIYWNDKSVSLRSKWNSCGLRFSINPNTLAPWHISNTAMRLKRNSQSF